MNYIHYLDIGDTDIVNDCELSRVGDFIFFLFGQLQVHTVVGIAIVQDIQFVNTGLINHGVGFGCSSESL